MMGLEPQGQTCLRHLRQRTGGTQLADVAILTNIACHCLSRCKITRKTKLAISDMVSVKPLLRKLDPSSHLIWAAGGQTHVLLREQMFQ